MNGRDWVQFHLQSKEIARRMHETGISSWNLRYDQQKTGVTGVLALFYYVFGPRPIYFLFLNAAMYSATLLLIYKTFCKSPYSLYGIFFNFFVLPSTLILYTQIHNDLFILFAVALYFYSIKAEICKKTLVFVFISYLLIWIVRPYLLSIFIVFFSVRIILELNFKKSMTLMIISFLSFAFFYNLEKITYPVQATVIAPIPSSAGNETSRKEDQPLIVEKGNAWSGQTFIPTFITNKFYQIAVYRDGFNATKSDENSYIDSSVSFKSSWEVIKYAPRALFISLFAPFPDFWFSKKKNTSSKSSGLERLTASLEMAWFYIVYFLFFLSLFKIRPTKDFISNVILFVLFLTLFATVVSNMGTLYRMRMPYFLILQIILLEKIFTATLFLNKKQIG